MFDRDDFEEYQNYLFYRLKKAAEAIYMAAYWTADRQVDEIGLWTELRDALGLAPDTATKALGLTKPVNE